MNITFEFQRGLCQRVRERRFLFFFFSPFSFRRATSVIIFYGSCARVAAAGRRFYLRLRPMKRCHGGVCVAMSGRDGWGGGRKRGSLPFNMAAVAGGTNYGGPPILPARASIQVRRPLSPRKLAAPRRPVGARTYSANPENPSGV